MYVKGEPTCNKLGSQACITYVLCVRKWANFLKCVVLGTGSLFCATLITFSGDLWGFGYLH